MSEETQNTEAGDDWGAAMEEQSASDVGTQSAADTDVDTNANVNTDDGAKADVDATAASEEAGDADYERAAFKDLKKNTGQLTTGIETNLDVILDIPVTLSMEIGRTELPINSLLQLNQGSVVELDRLAGEPMDVLINGTLIAHGEVVVINEKFGIRLTDVISPAERVKKLK
ncbi:Flagellar motor switch protein FliN [hydrothermal vent metagenome]|uniref:Flagellar motor switch protein FliN n=1 Tax=hydrothermal vent metagenome TaxID=652676 RepID=A0A3B0XDP9_9ZZZZ